MELPHTQNHNNALLKTEQLVAQMHQRVTFLHSSMLVELEDRRNKAETRLKKRTKKV